MALQTPPWGDDPLFEWDEVNEPHIALHDVTAFEVEECFDAEYRIQRHKKAIADPERYGNRYAVFGTTASGRELIIIIQHQGGKLIRPITGWEI